MYFDVVSTGMFRPVIDKTKRECCLLNNIYDVLNELREFAIANAGHSILAISKGVDDTGERKGCIVVTEDVHNQYYYISRDDVLNGRQDGFITQLLSENLI